MQLKKSLSHDWTISKILQEPGETNNSFLPPVIIGTMTHGSIPQGGMPSSSGILEGESVLC